MIEVGERTITVRIAWNDSEEAYNNLNSLAVFYFFSEEEKEFALAEAKSFLEKYNKKFNNGNR